MSGGAHVTIDTGALDELAKGKALQAIDAAARELGAGVLESSLNYLTESVYTRPNIVVTAEKMKYVPEPTGALRASGYMRTFLGALPPGVKNEAEAESSARASNGEVKFGTAPPGPARLGQCQVLFAVEYGIYVEMGTHRMAARHYLIPSAEAFQGFAESFILAKLREAGFE